MSERMHLGTTELHFAREQRRLKAAGRQSDAMTQWTDRLCQGRKRRMYQRRKGPENSNMIGFISSQATVYK